MNDQIQAKREKEYYKRVGLGILYSEREEEKNMTHEEKYGNYYFDWEDYVPQDFDETEITEDCFETISKEEMESLQETEKRNGR